MKIKPSARNALALAVFGCSGGTVTLACGPDFPMELTSARNDTLYNLVEGNFYYETGQLGAKPARLLTPDPRIGKGYETETAYVTDERRQLETQGYSEEQLRQFDAARASTNASEAFATAQGLPIAHQHYLAGAVAFQHLDFTAARAHFDAIVELAGNNDRLLWAHYMLAKTEYAENGLTPRAIASFLVLRNLGYQGIADPHGLALSSLGDEALWHLQDADNAARPFATRFIDALTLYGEQALQERNWLEQLRQSGAADYFYGNDVGQSSLKMLATRLVSNGEERAQVIEHPLVQQLLMSYLFSQGAPGNAALVDELVDVIERSNVQPVFADRAAAVLYRAGDFDRAGRFAQLSEAAIAYWVRAKLALRAGNTTAAAAAYAVAARSFPDEAPWVEFGWQSTTATCRVQAESATLALTRGDFLQAMTLFHLAGEDFYNDLAYVAERVLTIEELQQFVDSNTVATPMPPPDPDVYVPLSVDTRLRALLARRLLRNASYTQALPYFDIAADRIAAETYASALIAADNARGIAKAQLLHTAGMLARHQGMELLGSELEPDFKVYDGSYSYTAREETQEPLLIVQDELQRLGQNAVTPFSRFSYRYVATDLLEQATALVPERSQAYAAMLCHATNWMINVDPPRAHMLYERYIDKGAYVTFGSAFGKGRGCEEPDFARAEALQDRQIREGRIALLKRVWPYVAASAGTIVLAAGALILRRRGRQQRA